jgi:hypothetical protein
MTRERKLELLTRFGFDNLASKIDIKGFLEFNDDQSVLSIKTKSNQTARHMQDYVHNEISLECERDDEYIDILGGSINDMLQILDTFEKEIVIDVY